MLTTSIFLFHLRVLVRTILFFLAATLVDSRVLEATYVNVFLQLLFCIVFENLMYPPMYTQIITTSSHQIYTTFMRSVKSSSHPHRQYLGSSSQLKPPSTSHRQMQDPKTRIASDFAHPNPRNQCSDRHCHSSFPRHPYSLRITAFNTCPHDSPKTHHQSD
jgi:hypothetical protein